MNLFTKLEKGLREAIEFEAGDNNKASRVRRSVDVKPLPKFTPKEIKALRLEFNLTQKNFATLMGVSLETVSKWEQGGNSPSGSTLRLLEILHKRPQVIAETDLLSL